MNDYSNKEIQITSNQTLDYAAKIQSLQLRAKTIVTRKIKYCLLAIPHNENFKSRRLSDRL
jgi:hypothetical protein